VLLVAAPLLANDLTVDRRSLSLTDSLTITVTLENAFADIDNVNLPVRNLAIDGQPSVSSEFSWINGTSMRRKVLRFTAHPLAPGPALVGPLVIDAGGQRDTLGPVSLQVLPDVAGQSNDPLTVLHALETTNREPFFIITDVDKSSCYAGEELIVTWYLYNAAAVQRWQIAHVPKLDDFWIEEIDVRSEAPEQVIVGTQPMQKVPIRRVALFPLHSGELTIGPMRANAEILRRIDGDSPFGLFEGSLVEVPAVSPPMTVDVRPVPVQESGDLVGDVDLECTPPQQRGGGPVAMTVTLSGRANLRAASAPRFAGPVDGDVQVQPLAMDVNKTRDGATMRRSWRVLIFPAHAGTLRLPRVTADVFTPLTSQRVHLQCAEASLQVSAGARSAAAAPPRARERFARALRAREFVPWLGGTLLLVVALLIFVPRARRATRMRGQVRELVRDASPHEVRARVEALLASRGINAAALAAEASDRGDAFRALRSLLDALERDRVLGHEAENDMELRVRDLLQSIA
jgi:hypothetical protein